MTQNTTAISGGHGFFNIVIVYRASAQKSARFGCRDFISAYLGGVNFTNRLAREKSPYLLQHAHNPVDWFAWNAEAFEKARRENKPIFLSVGYSTCHWCHVMERESFEDERIGKFLNEHFVSIKVDREERPDVDKIYMTFVQATTGSGGWPMNVFLTPDLKPFYGGTYFPPDARYGRPSFLQLLEHIVKLWQERQTDISASAGEIHARLEEATAMVAEKSALNENILRNASNVFKKAFDPRHGGFGGAPKFPQPSTPQLLLRCAKRFADDEAKEMVLKTCDAMARGGIHDQLGGGFARYSVDAEWLVPHFEKMLYDNAQLTQLYLDAFLISGDRRHADVARDILDYVLRDMTQSGGGFYSAEDADSEGHEGKFYCWTKDELSKLLSPEEFNVAANYFGITAEGNFVDHSHPQPLSGQNVLSVANPIGVSPSQISKEKIRDAGTAPLPDDFELLESAKAKMLAARAERIRPHLDDKILASWNGLMLGAFARAGIVLGEEKYLAAAEKNLKFIREKLWQPAQDDAAAPAVAENRRRDACATLFHRWRDGERDDVQLLNGYAFYLSGVIDLYEATLNPMHLKFAIELAEAMLAKFYDSENGGFWQSAAGSKDLILRIKDDYDGAEPSGNSVAVLSLLKLGAITGGKKFIEAAAKTLQLFAHRLEHFPQAMPFMLHALDFSLQEPNRVVVAGDVQSANFYKLLQAAHSVFQPNKIISGNSEPAEEFARTLPAKGGATVYLCSGNSCQPPIHEPAALVEALSQ
jgi:uncharacterized protein YyaL (SSP411 family)